MSRLEEIKGVVKSQKKAVRELSYNDLKWLIEQAERLEVLEEENEQLKADVNALENEIFHGKKNIEFETYRKIVRGEIEDI